MPAAGMERSKKSERAAYVSRPRAPCSERPGVDPGRWQLGVGGEGRAARVGLHRAFVRMPVERDTAGRSADPRGQTVDRVLEFAVRAERERGDGDGRCAAVLEMAGGPDLVRLVGAPLLPGPEHRGGPRPRPRHIGRHRLGRRVGPEAQLGHDAEVAVARAAQGPEEVCVLGGARDDLLAVRRDQGRLGEAVAGQSVRPGDHAVAAAERETRDADGGAGSRGNRHALRGQRPVDVDELGAGTDDRLAGARPYRVQLAHVDDQTVVPGGPTGVGVAPVAYGDLDALGACVRQHGADVVRVCRVCHRRGLQGVEAGVVELPGRGPGPVTGADQGTVQVLGQGLQVGRGTRAARGRGGGRGRCRGRRGRTHGRAGGGRCAAGAATAAGGGDRRHDRGGGTADERTPLHVRLPWVPSNEMGPRGGKVRGEMPQNRHDARGERDRNARNSPILSAPQASCATGGAEAAPRDSTPRRSRASRRPFWPGSGSACGTSPATTASGHTETALFDGRGAVLQRNGGGVLSLHAHKVTRGKCPTMRCA